MELHFFIFLYILLVAVIVEKFAYRRFKIKKHFNETYQKKRSERLEKRKRRGFVHLIHAYLISTVLLILVVTQAIVYNQLPYFFLAIFFSFGVSFIYLFNKLFISLLSLVVIIFLVFVNISFLREEIVNLQFSPSFYFLIVLTIFPLYLAIAKK